MARVTYVIQILSKVFTSSYCSFFYFIDNFNSRLLRRWCQLWNSMMVQKCLCWPWGHGWGVVERYVLLLYVLRFSRTDTIFKSSNFRRSCVGQPVIIQIHILITIYYHYLSHPNYTYLQRKNVKIGQAVLEKCYYRPEIFQYEIHNVLCHIISIFGHH